VLDEDGFNKVRFKDGTVYAFNKGLKGNIALIEDRYRNAMTFTYDEHGGLKYVTDAVGRQVEIVYNQDDFIGTIIAMPDTAEQRTMHFSYTNGYLTKVVDFDGKATTYGYVSTASSSPPSLLNKITDAENHSIHFEYGEGEVYGTCTRVHKDEVDGCIIGDTRYEYDLQSNITRIDSIVRTDSETTPKTYRTTKYYDETENKNYYALKRITRIDDPYSGITSYKYDDMFHLTETTDTNSLVHKMEYDAMGNMVKKRADPEGLNYTMYWSYEPQFNQVVSFTDANGHTKRYYYVGDGQGGGSGHGPIGVLWKEVDAEENAIEHWYNEDGQRIKTLDANSNVTEYEYDDEQWDNLTRVIKHSQSFYKRSIEDPPGGEGVFGFDATYTYDRWGNKTEETDFNGKLTKYEYDPMNRIEKKTVYDTGQEGQPFVTDYTYYPDGNKHTMTDPRRKVTIYEYDAGNRLTDVIEPVNGDTGENRHTIYDYDTEGNKISEMDPNGNVTRFKYDAMNRLIEKIEPLNKITKYYYNGSGDSSTDGGSPEYTRKKDRYTEMWQRREDEDRAEVIWIKTYYHYDKLYRLDWIKDAKNGYTKYGYDPVGNKKWEEDAEERRTHFDYYDNNLLWKIIDPMPSPTPNTIVYTYDGMGNKASEEDKNLHKTEYEHGDRNLLTKVTYPKPTPTGPDIYVEYTYDGMNKRKERDKNGNVTEFEYNARNLPTKTIWPIGDPTTYEYDANGNKTLETDPNGNKVHYEYNDLNRLKTKTDAYEAIAGLTTTYYYDNVGNRVKIKDAEDRITHYDYDALNRLWQVRDALGGHTEYGYDRLGNKIWVKDAEGYEKGYQTDYYYDTLNRLKRVVNPLSKETRYDYDKVGNRTDQWNAKQQHIHYDYDDLNRLTLRTFDGAGGSIGYGYDPVGNRTSMTDSRTGMEDVGYDYDTLNRLTDVTYNGSGKTIHYEYDGNGNRTLMRGPEGGETVYEYDSMNRLDYLDDPDTARTNYEYDDGGRLTDMWYPNGTWTHYTYDEANRITGIVTKNSLDETIQSISYRNPDESPAYDKVGNRKRMVDSTGTTTYDYDALYRLEKVVYPGGKTVEYEYDAVGNRDFKKVNGVTVEDYDYNDANQLIHRQFAGTGTLTKEITVTGTVSDPLYWSYSGVESVTVNGMEAEIDGESFTAEGVELHLGQNTISAVAKDVAGNTTAHDITVTYDPDITGSYSYEYDNNGNLEKMTKTVDGEDDEVTQYEYDYENRLTHVIMPDTHNWWYQYDGDKRMVSKSDPIAMTRFFYDGVNNLIDYDEDMEIQLASYTHGVGIDKLIRRKDSNGVRYYHADALGSTRMLTDPDESTAATYVYDAWGKITEQSGETSNRHKFTGRDWDEAINLQYNRARFYDPETGRFITQDPLTKGPDDPTICYKNNIYAAAHRVIEEFFNSMQPDRLNRYAYCRNNPINFIDPLGLDDEKSELEDKINNNEEEEETERNTRTERDRRRIKDEIDSSDLSDKEKKELRDSIDDMSVPEFNQFRRDWDGATERAEGRFNRLMAQQERWSGNDGFSTERLSGWERAGSIAKGTSEIAIGIAGWVGVVKGSPAVLTPGGAVALLALSQLSTYSISLGICEIMAGVSGEKANIPNPIVEAFGAFGAIFGSEEGGRALGFGVNVAIDVPRYGPLDIPRDAYSVIKTLDNLSEAMNDPLLNDTNRR
jgi:RHS repeat-associated protein